MDEPQNPIQILPSQNWLLTAEDFLRLSGVPPEVEWFANLTNISWLLHSHNLHRSGINNLAVGEKRITSNLRINTNRFITYLLVIIACSRTDDKCGYI